MTQLAAALHAAVQWAAASLLRHLPGSQFPIFGAGKQNTVLVPAVLG